MAKVNSSRRLDPVEDLTDPQTREVMFPWEGVLEGLPHYWRRH